MRTSGRLSLVLKTRFIVYNSPNIIPAVRKEGGKSHSYDERFIYKRLITSALILS